MYNATKASTDDAKRIQSTYIGRLEAALEDILDLAEAREDVADGSDGRPRPDAWMQVAMMARRALGRMD